MSHAPLDANNVPTPADKAEQLYHDYLAGGPNAAYASLKKDYDNSACMTDRDQYWKQVADDLRASGHMPNLAVGWLKEEKGNIDTDGDGVISKQEVISARAHGGLDALFSKEVMSSVPSPGDNKTFYDQLAHTRKAWNQDPDGIEDADINKYNRQEHRAERRVYNQNEVAKAAEPLLDNHEELARFLDARKDGSEGNGFISRHEMKTFLKNYKEHQGEGLYTPENAEYVNELLHGENARVHNPPFHGFAIDRLEKRAGMKPDYQNVSWDQDDAPETDKNCVVDSTQVKPTVQDLSVQTKTTDATQTVAKQPDVCANLEIVHKIEELSRVKTHQGYDAVAARLLNITDHPRTAEEVKEIKTLGQEIKAHNGNIDTHKLRTDVVLPVAANLNDLLKEDKAFSAAVDQMRRAQAEKAQTTQTSTQTQDQTQNQTQNQTSDRSKK